MRILDELSGITFIENPLLEKEVSKQYRFPRSKKKRIRKKWSKLYRKITLVPIDPIFCVEQKTLAMHPWTGDKRNLSSVGTDPEGLLIVK